MRNGRDGKEMKASAAACCSSDRATAASGVAGAVRKCEKYTIEGESLFVEEKERERKR